MPYFTFSSIFHERLNGQFSLFPLKISAVGRSKNGEGVLQVVSQGLLKEKVLLIYLPKYRRGGCPLAPLPVPKGLSKDLQVDLFARENHMRSDN